MLGPHTRASRQVEAAAGRSARGTPRLRDSCAIAALRQDFNLWQLRKVRRSEKADAQHGHLSVTVEHGEECEPAAARTGHQEGPRQEQRPLSAGLGPGPTHTLPEAQTESARQTECCGQCPQTHRPLSGRRPQLGPAGLPIPTPKDFSASAAKKEGLFLKGPLVRQYLLSAEFHPSPESQRC